MYFNTRVGSFLTNRQQKGLWKAWCKRLEAFVKLMSKNSNSGDLWEFCSVGLFPYFLDESLSWSKNNYSTEDQTFCLALAMSPSPYPPPPPPSSIMANSNYLSTLWVFPIRVWQGRGAVGTLSRANNLALTKKLASLMLAWVSQQDTNVNHTVQ